MPSTLPNQWEKCIENCLECYRVCAETITYCLTRGGDHAEVKHIQLLMDCTALCQISADFMIRGSSCSPDLCKVCADVCGRCADDCERFVDDDQMQACADVCRKCAAACREMMG